MAIDSSQFSVDSSGNLRHVSGTTVYSVLELHAWLQDLADNPAPTSDDNVSILGAVPSVLAGKRNTSRPSALTLLNGINIDDETSHHFNFGSIEQDNGNTLFTGVNTIGSGLAGRSIYVVQNSAKYNSGTKWWNPGPVRALFKVKSGGALIDSGLLTFYSREWGYDFSHFEVDGSPGSEQVAALSVAVDPNISRASGNYSGGPNTVTSTSPAFTVTVTFGDTTQSLGSFPNKLYKGTISWTGAASLVEVYQALQWACHENSTTTLNGQNGWRYKKLNAAYTENLKAPFGTFAGGKWFVAQGWWLDPASLNSNDLQSYTLTSHDGTLVTPPNAIALTAGNLAVGDYVLVGKDDGAGGFVTSIGVTASGTAGANTVTLSSASLSDVPATNGYIRINGNPHTYTSIVGTSVSGLSPVVPAGGYSNAGVWFPFIDKQTSSTSENSGTFNLSAPFTARIRVRNGGGSPIVPFETTFTVSGATTINAIRADDI